MDDQKKKRKAYDSNGSWQVELQLGAPIVTSAQRHSVEVALPALTPIPALRPIRRGAQIRRTFLYFGN